MEVIMKKFGKKFALMMLVGALGMSALVGCGSNNGEAGSTPSQTAGESKSKYTTVIAGTQQMNGVFNPFFYTTAYDKYAWQYVFDSLLKLDRTGALEPSLADYTIDEQKGENGEAVRTVYTFTLKEATFSDGEPVTADDVIFTYKVYSDPTYDGMSTFNTTPIVGMNEYRYDDAAYADKIAALKEDANQITEEEIKTYIYNSCEADYDRYGAEAVLGAIGQEDLDVASLDDAAKKEKIVAAYAAHEIEKSLESYRQGAVNAKYKALEKEYIASNLSGGSANVTEIEGIKKIDDRTVEITVEGVDPKALTNLAITVMPAHYYGVAEDGTTWSKGDLSVIKSRNGVPMGSGPYVFERFENNIVSLTANENYFLGAPLTPTIRLQVTSTANKLEAVRMGEMDISDPVASPQMLEDVKSAEMEYQLVDNLGYGYIGINSQRVSDKNVRKGLMHLMNRGPAVETYYGELASIIERPMSKVSWAYPQDAEEVYGFSPAKALEYFVAAGYEQVQQGGNLVLQKNGEQLRLEVGIPGDGTMDHPSAPILTQMKTEIEKLGGILDISDTDGSVFFDRLNSGGWDIFVAAWGATPDPDMYQVYYSSGPSNHYKLTNAQLDELIVAGRSTNDIEERKEIYAKALDIIMEEAVEMPVYQRKNMFIFNPEVVDTTTLPEGPTPFYTPFYDNTGEIYTLKLK
jgi:peptide/nickel transport system substrate-binding protein